MAAVFDREDVGREMRGPECGNNLIALRRKVEQVEREGAHMLISVFKVSAKSCPNWLNLPPLKAPEGFRVAGQEAALFETMFCEDMFSRENT